MIRKLMILGMIVTGSALMGNVEVHGNVYTVDAYGDNWQKKASDMEVGEGRHFLSGLSKKKTADIVIYPSPRD